MRITISQPRANGAAAALIGLALLCLAATWVVVLYAVAGIVTIVGRTLDGKGTAAGVRAALAWGLVPVVWSVFFRIPLAVYSYRLDLRPRDRAQMLFDFVQQGDLTVAIVYATLQLLMNVCVLFVASNALGEALSGVAVANNPHSSHRRDFDR